MEAVIGFIIGCVITLLGIGWSVYVTERDLKAQDMLEDIDEDEWWN